MSESYIFDAVRTPRGKGRLKDGALADHLDAGLRFPRLGSVRAAARTQKGNQEGGLAHG